MIPPADPFQSISAAYSVFRRIDFPSNRNYIAFSGVDDIATLVKERVVKTYSAIAAVLIAATVSALHAQSTPPVKPDSTIVFGTMTPSVNFRSDEALAHSWGVDLLISNGGFGLGTFYRHEYSDVLSGFIDFSISEAKDDDEKDFYDFYGQRFTPGKVNRFLVMPLFVGLQKRLFKDDILDNFRPYINIAGGPSMIYVFPNDVEYFSAIGDGHPRYTVGGYVGLGAFFGDERSSLMGLNLRYYYVPFGGGLESMRGVSKNQFGGFFITLNFGSAW